MDACDALVVGAGPAGLAAAVYLARFRRNAIVLNGGRSRASWIPKSHNTPGFPHGVAGDELLARLICQALEFGVEIRQTRAESVQHSATGFTVSTFYGAIHARTVLLATGVVDRLPNIPGIEEGVRRGLVRMCPICDAFEATGKRLAVLGDGDLAIREAEFLSNYSEEVTVIGQSEGQLRLKDATIEWVSPDGKTARTFDHLYLALGCDVQAALAVDCGAATDPQNNLVVDGHQMTSVTGLYAAGDVVLGLNQIAVATGEAARAATAMHNLLRTGAP